MDLLTEALKYHQMVTRRLNDEYKIKMFPASLDKQTPLVGYLPGHMPFGLGESLHEISLNTVNNKAHDTCHIDRTSITGASSNAIINLGRLTAQILL